MTEPGDRLNGLLDLTCTVLGAGGALIALRLRTGWLCIGYSGREPALDVPLDPALEPFLTARGPVAWSAGEAPSGAEGILVGAGGACPIIDDEGYVLGVLVADDLVEPLDERTVSLHLLARQAAGLLIARRERDWLADLSTDLIALAHPLGVPVPSSRRPPVDACGAALQRAELLAGVRRQAELVRAATQAGQLGGWRIDLSEGEVFWSPQLFQMHGAHAGYTPSIDYPSDFFEGAELEKLQRALTACFERAAPFDVEVSLITDGEHTYLRYIGEPVRGKARKIVAMQGAVQDLTQARQAEHRAERIAGRLSRVVEAMSDAFFVLDEDMRLTFFNSRFVQLVERDRSELLNQVVWDVFPNIVGTVFEERYTEAVTEGRAVMFEGYAPLLQKWLSVSGYPTPDGVAVFFQDLSEIMSRKRALAISEERFKLLAELAHDIVFDWDVSQDEIWWSPGLRRVLGHDVPDSSLGLSFWIARLHPEDRSQSVADLWRCMRNDADTWSRRLRVQHADGQYIVVEHRWRIMRDESGAAVRVVGGLRDLTQDLRQQEVLNEQAALLDEVPGAIMVTDEHGRVAVWSAGAASLYGWSSDEAVGRPLHEVVGADPDTLEHARVQVVQGERVTGELELRHRSGSAVVVEVRWRTLSPGSRVLSIHVDITERKRLEQQFLRAQRLESIGTLAGGIAHDLNNMLTPVLISAELLQAEPLDPDRAELISTIHESAQRGAALVAQVLAFAGGAEGHQIVLPVARIVNEAAKLARDTFPPNIGIEVELSEPLGEVIGDPTQLQQVLVNLCVNARDAMPMGGALRLAARQVVLDETYAALQPDALRGTYICIDVEDDGEGMRPEHVSRIFDPFFTTKQPGSGTGLGLSTSAAIVRSHGGFIQVYSELKRGTTFHVYLPLTTQVGAPDAAVERSPDPPRGAGERLLVVDDEKTVRDVTARTLEAFGYRVITAEDGAHALSIFAREMDRIDLVLTDMMMPVMDGPALIHALRRLRSDLPIVAASGMNANGRVARALGEGVQHFLPKPYSAEALLRAVRRALDELRAR